MTQAKGIAIKVDGRTFVQEPPTFEQEMYIMDTVVETGIDRIPSLQLDSSSDKPDLEAVAKHMIVRAYRSGALFRLMASLVVEEGTEWSKEACEEIADLFRTTRDVEAKKQLQPALVGAIFAFFESAGDSDLTSRISSDDLAELHGPVDIKPTLTPVQAEAVFRTGNMKLPSSKSATTTASRPSRSSVPGKSGTGSSRVRPSGGK